MQQYVYANNYTTTLAQPLFGSTTTTATLTKNVAYTAVPVAALDGPVAGGDVVTLSNGTTSMQITVAAGGASEGATSIPAVSFTPAATYNSGSSVAAAFSAISLESVVGAPANPPYTLGLAQNGASGPVYDPYEVVVIIPGGLAQRGQEGTTPQPWAVGDRAGNDWTAMAAMGLVPALTLQQFGGVPDGETDNTTAWNEALAAAALIGLPLFVGPGEWYVATTSTVSIHVPSNVEVYGVRGWTVLTGGATGNYFIFEMGTQNVHVHHLTFSGNGSGITTKQGSDGSPNTNNIKVDHCDFLQGSSCNYYCCNLSEIDSCFCSGAITQTTLTSGLTVGDSYDSISVVALTAAISSGTPMTLNTMGLFQTVTTAANANIGDTTISLVPFTAASSWGVGVPVGIIGISTGIQMNGYYQGWSTYATDSGAWCVRSTIRNCTVQLCNAANIFINMGYLCTIENCRCSVGHDMCLDFEYCLQCTMIGNTCEYGGNRGIACETVNSLCSVLGNQVRWSTQDGVRVTTDLVPSGNPYDVGAHSVNGNTLCQCSTGGGNGGICMQGVADCVIGSNNVSECGTCGINLYDTKRTTVTGNAVHRNYGPGILELNTANNQIETNDIYLNGTGMLPYSNPVAGPTLSLGSASSYLVDGESYAVQYAWVGMPTIGQPTQFIGPPSLPSVVTMTAVNQVIDLAAITFPTGATGIAIYVVPKSSLSLADIVFFQAALVATGVCLLGTIDTSGNITYAGGATTGLAASVAGGAVTVTVSAPPALSIANPGSALALTQAPGSSPLTATTYTVVAWEASNGGVTKVGTSPASITLTAAGNTIGVSYTLQPGSFGVHVGVGTTGTPPALGFVAPDGAVTYSGSAASGITASVAGGTLTLTLAAPSSATGTAEPATNTTTDAPSSNWCAGVYMDPSTGANNSTTLVGNHIIDNGYVGIGPIINASNSLMASFRVNGGEIIGHTACAVIGGGHHTSGPNICDVEVQGSYQGIGISYLTTGGQIADCDFSAITDAAIRFMSPGNNWQSMAVQIHDNTFGDPGASGNAGLVGTGIYIDANLEPYVLLPNRAHDNSFVQCTTPINLNGGTTYPVLVTDRNLGYNPVGSAVTTPAVPASGVYVTNTNPFAVLVTMHGASGITTKAGFLPQTTTPFYPEASPDAVELDAWASIKATTPPPGWVWIGR